MSDRRILQTALESGIQTAIQNAETSGKVVAGARNLIECLDTGNIYFIKSKLGNANFQLVPMKQRVFLTALSFTSGVIDREEVMLKEYYSGTSLGGGIFRWYEGDTSASDGGGVFQVSGGSWKRVSHTDARTYRPEDFGCIGDGTTDDYYNFRRLAKAMSGTISAPKKGIKLILRGGSTYFLNQYRILAGFESYSVAPNGVTSIQFANIDGLTIEGNSARVLLKGNFYRRGLHFNYAFTAGSDSLEWWDSPDTQVQIEFIHVNRATGGNFTIEGQAPLMTSQSGQALTGGAKMYVGDGSGAGLAFYHVTNSRFDNTKTLQNQTDGLYISGLEYGVVGFENEYGANSYQPSSQNIEMHNHVSLFNRRQGCSLVHIRDIYFYGGDLSYTGWGSIGVSGEGVTDTGGWLRPAYGLNIEPTFKSTNPAPNRANIPNGKVRCYGTRFKENKLGPIGNLQSLEVEDVVFDGVEIDMRLTTHSEAFLKIAGNNSKLVNSVVRLNNNGFLFYDALNTPIYSDVLHGTQDKVNTTISNNDIFLTGSLGQKDYRVNVKVSLDKNRIYLPEQPSNPVITPILFSEIVTTSDSVIHYELGNHSKVSFTGNRVVIPYSYYSSAGTSQKVIQLSGIGSCYNNIYETSGTKPAGWVSTSSFGVDYQSQIAGGKTEFVTNPQNEIYPKDGSIVVVGYTTAIDRPFSWPSGQQNEDADQPLSLYTGQSREFPAGKYLWYGERVIRPFYLLQPLADQFSTLTSAPNTGETLVIQLVANNVVLAEYSWVSGSTYNLTGGSVVSAGWPYRVEHDSFFEIRSFYTRLAPSATFPERTYATGLAFTFLRRFAPGKIPV